MVGSRQAMLIKFMQSCGDVCCGENRLNRESGITSSRLAVVERDQPYDRDCGSWR